MKIVCIHGVSEVEDARGFSDELRDLVFERVTKHNKGNPASKLDRPKWLEVVYSQLMDLPGSTGVAALADYLVDVARYTSSAALREKVASIFRSKVDTDDIIVAHSLGSIVAIREIERCARLGLRRPFAALVTIGSPAGLSIPLLSVPLIGDLEINWRPLADALRPYRSTLMAWRLAWLDFWAAGDAIHSGSILGVGQYGARGLSSASYPCASFELDHGTDPSIAHSQYWRSPIVSAHLFSIWTKLK